jgi:hypothetical protein
MGTLSEGGGGGTLFLPLPLTFGFPAIDLPLGQRLALGAGRTSVDEVYHVTLGRASPLAIDAIAAIAHSCHSAIALAAYSIFPLPAYLAGVTWERFLLQAAVPLLVLLAYALTEIGRHLRAASGSLGLG